MRNLILFCLLTLFCATAAETGKVALAGTSYAGHEKRVIVNRVLLPSADEEYVYTDAGSDLPWESLDAYQLIIVSTKLTTEANEARQVQLREWVQAGGHLVVIHRAADALQLEWAGITSTVYLREAPTFEVRAPDHPLLSKVPLTPDPPWLTRANIVARTQAPMQTLIGTEDMCLVGTATVGDGAVAYLGMELFRLRLGGLDPADAWLTLLQELVRRADPLTIGDLREEQLAAWQARGRQLLVWTREWTRGEPHGPRFLPPLPVLEEQVDSLDLHLAIGEVESLQINLTPVQQLSPFSWELDPGAFPADQVEFLVQDRPDPLPWPKAPELSREAPYWLLPPDRVAPKGKPEVSLPAPGHPRILWLRIHTHDIEPGSYQLRLRLQVPGLEVLEVPVDLTVYPVRLPRRRLISLGPGGTVYGDVNKPAPAVRFSRNLQAHGVEWGIANTLRPNTLTVDGDAVDNAWLKTHRDQLRPDGPTVNFAAMDPWFDQAIDHGLTSLRVFSTTYLLDSMTRRLGYTEEQQRQARLWLRTQYGNYLRAKGYRTFLGTRGDELSPAELREHWLPWAREMARADWRCTSAFSWGQQTPELTELIREIAPHVGLWTLNRQRVEAFLATIQSGQVQLPDHALVGTYGAGEGRGSDHRKPLARSRYLGWDAWRLGIDNCLPNPYFKGWIYYSDYGDRGEAGGVAGERFVSYIDRDDLQAPLADSPFWEGIRDGLEEGNLAAMLEWYLERLDQPAATAELQGLRAYTAAADSTTEYRHARRRVLELMDSLDTSGLAPSLYWNHLPLIVDGEPQAAIDGPDDCLEVLNQHVLQMTGQTLPRVQDEPATPIRITFAQTELAAEQVPPPGTHRIYEQSNTDRTQLIIATGSGLSPVVAARRFAAFLRSEGGWRLTR